MILSPSSVIRASALLGAMFMAVLSLAAQGSQPFRHTLRFAEARNHYVHVESTYPTGGAAELEVFMAVWTPGSYLVREYARNIDSVEAVSPSGARLEVVKTRKNRWKVRTGGAASVTLRYPVYSREMSVRTNFVDASFAMIQGAATFLSPVSQNARPHLVKLELPADWSRAMSGLQEVPAESPHTFLAADYDTLVDCPIVAGNPDVFEFEVEGKKHYLVNTPPSPHWDGPRSVAAVKRIVEHYSRMWGGLPYDRYLFLNMLVEAGGGLEHKNSTTLMAGALTMRNDDLFLGNPFGNPPRGGWLELVSHEFFHVWNVKRLRPFELGPFDYENENYSESLWISEGFTSYYESLALRRAGLIDRENYLARLSGTIASLESRPGRLVQPTADSSFDAWVKGYRPNENSPNTAISYYTKGAVIAFLLDARVRKATGGERSLDDVMRLAYSRYSGERGYTPEDFNQCVREVAGAPVAEWLDKTVRSAEDLSYREALEYYGLRFRPLPSAANTPARGWLGAETRSNGASMVVSGLRRGTPAYEAGLNVDDEILAIGDRRVTPALWPRLGDYYEAGAQEELTVSRRGQIIKLPVTFGTQPRSSWRLELDPRMTRAQIEAISDWLAER